MTTFTFAVFAILMMIVQGCSHDEGPESATGSQTEVPPSAVRPTADAAEKAGPALLGVTKFSLTKDNLRLDYRVTNVFPDAIWVCVNMSPFPHENPKFTVETEICERTMRITRRASVEQTAFVTSSGVYAVYCRLQPGASRSDAVLLPLPVEDWSHVRFTRPPVRSVVLNQVVLELGYFREDLRDLISTEEDSRQIPGNAYFTGPDTVFISYISPRRWDKLHLEQSVQITISDINVPGRIP